MTLTTKRIPRLRRQPGRYLDAHGLYLQVLSPSNVSWLLRYNRNGRERWLGLGPLHTIGLAEARERARKARQQLLDGIDPLEAKRAARTAEALARARMLSFEDAAREYFKQHEPKWTNAKHRAQFLSSLSSYVFPKIGGLPVDAIDTGLVLKCIEPIWLNKTATASRVRGRIESVLDWATVRGYRQGDNPARWRGHLDNVLPDRKQVARKRHHAALPFTEIAAFMTALATRAGIAARALEFLILTAARTGEVVGATWEEIDWATNTWTVPAARIKGGREHRVPLCDRAVEILRSLPHEDGNPHMFIGGRQGGLSNMAMPMILPRMGYDVTVHGSAPPSATGQPSAPIIPITWWRWRWPTPSATRWRRLTGAATCLPSA